ncbi:MAG: SAM-dependent methyltransferase [Spirochaetota bacterium]
MGNEVIRYYDSNTARFLKYGQGAGSNAIHRAVWAAGVENRRQAMNYVNARIAASLSSAAAEKVLDIGCGVGGSMLYLARHIPVLTTPARIDGVTISPRQAEIGQQLIEKAECAERCSLVAGDFTDPHLPGLLSPPYDAAYAIESFLHMPAAELFFAQAARLLRSGGRLFVCDDFLAPQPKAGNPGRARVLARFRRGWQVRSLFSAGQTRRLAEQHGFILKNTEDLTPHLELNRPRDIGIRILVRLLGWLPIDSPFWNNLLGGDALQRLLLGGTIKYLLLRFEKVT